MAELPSGGNPPDPPERYDPVKVGSEPHTTTMRVSAPYSYVVGFKREMKPALALQRLSANGFDWQFSGREDPEAKLDQYRFTDTEAVDALTPDQTKELILDEEEIRYVVPVYRSDELGLASFTPVPNHVVVIADVDNQSELDEFDELLRVSDFRSLPGQEIERGDQTRLVYSSNLDEGDPNETLDARFTGEPGMSLALINAAPPGVVAELDWFVTNPNELETGATRTSGQTVASGGPATPIAGTLESEPTTVAILDGEFDLAYPGGNLPFGAGGVNVVDSNIGVGAIIGHAHGTLCAGIIGAKKATPGFRDGGLAPNVEMTPISIYAISNPIVATSSAMVKGIDAAVGMGSKVLSISVALLPSSDLQFTVEWADREGTLIVAGTGNLEAGQIGSANFVLYPAHYATVLGVGAAVFSPADDPSSLQRVTVAESAGEPLAWESRYGAGIDVVAKGLHVTSTDIHGKAGAVDGDVFDEFSGTSAAAPLVAAFAARIVADTNLNPREIRAVIRHTALSLDPYAYDSELDRPGWNAEVGFGLITRAVAGHWSDKRNSNYEDNVSGGEVADDPIGGANVSNHRMEKQPPDNYARDLEDPLVDCGPDITIKSVVAKLQCPYGGIFSDSLRPLGDFLQSLGSTDDCCCRMAAHFWRDPYRTARVAGVPWHAAVLLGQGDWEAIYEAVDAENHRNRKATGGPIWVRVH